LSRRRYGRRNRHRGPSRRLSGGRGRRPVARRLRLALATDEQCSRQEDECERQTGEVRAAQAILPKQSVPDMPTHGIVTRNRPNDN
jgi:hypothetical protein